MTKRFVLPDTLPNPHFTINVTGPVTVKTGQMESGGMMVEVWLNGTILCRVYAPSVQFDNTGGES